MWALTGRAEWAMVVAAVAKESAVTPNPDSGLRTPDHRQFAVHVVNIHLHPRNPQGPQQRRPFFLALEIVLIVLRNSDSNHLERAVGFEAFSRAIADRVVKHDQRGDTASNRRLGIDSPVMWQPSHWPAVTATRHVTGSEVRTRTDMPPVVRALSRTTSSTNQ